MALAARVMEDCPSGKTPALLLTVRDDVDEGARVMGSYYVLVVNLPRYLESADADAAVSYLAGRLGPGITRARRFPGAAELEEEQLDDLLEQRLDGPALMRWAGLDRERLALLGALAGGTESPANGGQVVDEAALVDTFERLGSLSPDVASAVAALIDDETEIEARTALLRALTDDVDGRYTTAEMLRDRTADRLADAREAVVEFDSLLATSNETQLQEFLEINPWILGLDYAQMRARQPIVRGTLDFLLERFDGFHDLLELKSPQDGIVLAPDGRRGARASASQFRLSPALAQALAQVHVYRDALRDESVAEKHFGLPNAYEPRIIIVIGTAAEFSDERKRLLRELNRSLHRVEIVPYDWVGDRANAILDSVDRYLLRVHEASGE
jgi:hypothetical protein